jgi:hypothetical protein
VEKEAGDEEVGGEETCDGDGDDAVEGGCRADVYESENAGDEGGGCDGVDGDECTLADLDT